LTKSYYANNWTIVLTDEDFVFAKFNDRIRREYSRGFNDSDLAESYYQKLCDMADVPDEFIPDKRGLVTILPRKEDIRDQAFWKKYKPR